MNAIAEVLADLPLRYRRVLHVHAFQSVVQGIAPEMVIRWNRFGGFFRGRARWNDCVVLVTLLKPHVSPAFELRVATVEHFPPSFVTAAAETAGLRQIDQHTISVGMLGTVATILSDGVVLGIGFGRWAEITLASDQG